MKLRFYITIFLLLSVNFCFSQTFNKKILIGKWSNENESNISNFTFKDSINLDIELFPKAWKERPDLKYPIMKQLYFIENIVGMTFNLTTIDSLKNKQVVKCKLKNPKEFIIEVDDDSTKYFATFLKIN